MASIVRGDIGSTTARRAPVVAIAEAEHGTAFTGFQSWIPGGSLERLIWSWVEYSGPIPTVWSGVTKTLTDAHRFILPKPAAAQSLSSICLRIEGTQTAANGNLVNVVGGTMCSVSARTEVMEAPSWWGPVTVPMWLPDSAADAVLSDVIAGHVSLQSNAPLAKDVTNNTLVYFADWKADKPLEPLLRAFKQMRRKSASLIVIVVLPAGAFNGKRREVEAKLGSSEGFPALLLPTEDSEGGWTKTFAVAKTPAVHLINARRKFVWKHEGDVHPDAMAAALDEHLVAAPAPRPHPLRLTLAPGERAPDVSFVDISGEQFALRRLQGRDILLNFCQPWSAPCLKELQRLQALSKQAGEKGPFIVALFGSKDAKAIEEIRKQYGLSFPLVQDAEQLVARKYGVRCWPTTVSINADGCVGHVQFGIVHEHAASPTGK